MQQTRVGTVKPYYERFIKAFPDLDALAQAELQSVLKLWEGLGYYARARNLHKAAQIVVTKYNGRIPTTYEEFKQLPGVGDYIASAVMSIVFQQPHAVVDGNVKRVLSRIALIEQPVNDGKHAAVFKEIAGRLLDTAFPAEYNQAIMELGALVCRPRKPACTQCPVNELCLAYANNRQQDFPVRNVADRVPTQHIAVGVIRKNGKVLITRRKNEGLLGGLWEFPGGKVQPGETGESACLREIREEVNLDVDIVEHLKRVKHAYSHFKIVMDVFLCQYRSGRVHLNGAVDYRWIHVSEIEQYPFPGANHKFIPLLLEKWK